MNKYLIIFYRLIVGLVSAIVIVAPFFFVGGFLVSTSDIFIDSLSTFSYPLSTFSYFLLSSAVGFVFILFMTLIMIGFYELGKKLDTLSSEGEE